MLIEITCPIFRCAEDEQIFFSRLYDFPNVVSVAIKPSCVYLTLADTANKTVVGDLKNICNMWGATFKPLTNDRSCS
jgi:hypothetical protein